MLVSWHKAYHTQADSQIEEINRTNMYLYCFVGNNQRVRGNGYYGLNFVTILPFI